MVAPRRNRALSLRTAVFRSADGVVFDEAERSRSGWNSGYVTLVDDAAPIQ
jgi:hypothetical protein